MTTQEKTAFVNELIENIRHDVLTRVPLTPDTWDGHELRELIADRFDMARSLKRCHGRPRVRAYRNAVVVGNL
jgi:hypothetical protein